MDEPRALIERLNLAPHPEGGWYRETWRAKAPSNGRSAGTAILFLLEAGQASHWHQVDADEIWYWHSGSVLALEIASGDATSVERVQLGPDVLHGERPQALVPAGHWQSARADRGWALVSCSVVPGFDFAGFTLAPPGWSPTG